MNTLEEQSQPISQSGLPTRHPGETGYPTGGDRAPVPEPKPERV
ncbi:hypothetical protein [Streptomyces sp. 5-10]|nr:hypothetical protein [Streptomyces sp. 5-10]